MSTQEKFLGLVYEGVKALSVEKGSVKYNLLTLNEVAFASDVSAPTAKKHLMKLIKRGLVATFPVGRRWVYQYIGDGRDI